MQFAKSTGYALHALVQLAGAQPGTNLGVRELAGFLGVSESYLSKVMSKLRQDGLIRSAPGASGGYELARPAEDITFLDVIQAVEGRQPLYECAGFDAHRHALFAKPGAPEQTPGECLVGAVMEGAERQMHEYLRGYTIASILDQSALAHPVARQD